MNISRMAPFLWRILLILIFIRPFLSEYAFLTVGFWYISSLIFFSVIYLILNNKASLFLAPINFAIFLFIIAILISMIFSGFTSWSLLELYFFIPNVLIFYVVSTIKFEQRRQLIGTILFAASIIGVYALYQYFIGFSHISEYIKQACSHNSYYAEEILGRKRIYATFISPNIYSSYSAMMLFLAIGFLFAVREERKLTLWLYISIPIIAIALLLTKSLGGILAFVITFLLFLYCAIFYLLPNLGFKKIILRRVSLGMTFGLFIFIFVSGLFTWHRMPQFFNLNDPNNSIIQRFYYWKASLNMIKDSLLVGVGWRKFGSLYEFYKPFPANISHYSHNVFLQVMAETGLLGLLSFLGIVFVFLKTGLREIKNNNEQQGLKIGLFCAGCVFLVHNLFDLSFYFGQVSFFWWIILGFFALRFKNNVYGKNKKAIFVS